MGKLRKANRMVVGGAMAVNTMQLMKPNANYLGVAEGAVGIGLTGALTDNVFELMERKHRKARR